MFELFGQILKFVRVYRKYWLGPLLIGAIGLGGLLALAKGSAIAPFIYALF